MLRITLDINGRKIGTIGVHNKQEYDGSDVRYGVYDLRGYDMWGGELDDYPKIADVWHDRTDGAAALTARIMEEVDEDQLDGY